MNYGTSGIIDVEEGGIGLEVSIHGHGAGRPLIKIDLRYDEAVELWNELKAKAEAIPGWLR